MRIETVYDEILHAATLGLEPDDDDLERVTVPPGEEHDVFLSRTRLTARRIAEARRSGLNDKAREIADEAKDGYDSTFEALQPARAGQEPEALDDLATRMFRR